jgi:transglutaminase-like putative cysteine protease
MAYLNTPKKISAALDIDLTYPAKLALPGVTAAAHPTRLDLHHWGVELMRAHGIPAQVVAVTVDDRPQSVLIYRDPADSTWNAMNTRSISPTKASDPRDAVERYCLGRGPGASPDFVMQQPREFSWGPDDATAAALHSSIKIESHTSLSALGDISSLTYDQLVSRVQDLAKRDPLAAIDAIEALLGRGGPFTYKFHTDEPTKFTPETFWKNLYGVCAEYHIFAARMLREADIEAYPVEIFSPGLAHVVTVYKDPVTQKWNVFDYSTRHVVSANTKEEAIAAYDPTYYKMTFLDDDGGLPANRAVFVNPRITFVQGFYRRDR